jgi:hypothetical protein
MEVVVMVEVEPSLWQRREVRGGVGTRELLESGQSCIPFITKCYTTTITC